MNITDQELLAYGYEPRIVWKNDQPKTLWVAPMASEPTQHGEHYHFVAPAGVPIRIVLVDGIAEVVLDLNADD